MAFYADQAAVEAAFPNLSAVDMGPGGVYIGDNCTFGAGCSLEGDNANGDDWDGWLYRGPARIGDNNTFGVSCYIAPGTVIGDGNWFGGNCYFWGFPVIGSRNRCENESGNDKSYCYFWNGCTVGDDNVFGANSYVGCSVDSVPPDNTDEPWGSSSVGNNNTFSDNSYVWLSSTVMDDNTFGPGPGDGDSEFEIWNGSHISSETAVGENLAAEATLLGVCRQNAVPNPRACVDTVGWYSPYFLERVTGSIGADFPEGATAVFYATAYIGMTEFSRVPGSEVAWQVRAFVEYPEDGDFLEIGVLWDDYTYATLFQSAVDVLPTEEFELFSGSTEVPTGVTAFQLSAAVHKAEWGSSNARLYTTLWMVEAGDYAGDYADGDSVEEDKNGNRTYWAWFGDPGGGLIPTPVGQRYEAWTPKPHASMSYYPAPNPSAYAVRPTIFGGGGGGGSSTGSVSHVGGAASHGGGRGGGINVGHGGAGAPMSGGGGGGSGGAVQDYLHDGGKGGSGVVIVKTADGVFVFSYTQNFYVPETVTTEDILVVAGGGGGGCAWDRDGGGGGAGGIIHVTGHVLTVGTYEVVVGAGGVGGMSYYGPTNGGNSSIDSLVAIGGGHGGHRSPSNSTYASAQPATSGGSGGGGHHYNRLYDLTQPGDGISGQGYGGGHGYEGYDPGPWASGGGGGFSGPGENGSPTSGGAGGPGIVIDLFN